MPKYSSDKQCKSKVKIKQAEVPHMVELSLKKCNEGYKLVHVRNRCHIV